MQPLLVTKYEFTIRTRNGAIVEGLSIQGRDEEDARRKLAQMYRECEVLESRGVKASLSGRGNHPVSYEEVMDLIVSGQSGGN
ncbi:MAG: hypothetical protein H6R10_81 [Rhodocyclaceae bacterium]|nr:hypothetical protein [Rhodocyclaceae bacterium]